MAENDNGSESVNDDAFFRRLTDHIDPANECLTKKLTSRFESLVGKVGDEVRENRASIDEIRTAVSRIESEHKQLERKVDKIDSTSRPAGDDRINQRTSNLGNVFLPTQTCIKRTHNDEACEISRRTLRLWPTSGRTDTEIRNGSIEFIRKVLEVSTTDVGDDQIERTRHALYTRRTSAVLEAVVTFKSVYA